MDMTIEQLRGVVQARIAELDAYKHMEQVLLAVEQAQARYDEAQRHVEALAAQYDEKAEALEMLNERYAGMETVLEDRYRAREEQAKAKMKAMDEELAKKQATLASWQEHLASIEREHQQKLADVNGKVLQARDEYKAMQEKLAAVKGQFESFAAMVKG
jgi:chromosome segregation ATPase